MAERSKAFVLKTKIGNYRGFEPHSHQRRLGMREKVKGKNKGTGGQGC